MVPRQAIAQQNHPFALKACAQRFQSFLVQIVHSYTVLGYE